MRVVAFNTAEGWSRDVSEDIALEVLSRAAHDTRVPDATHDFVAFYIGEFATLRARTRFEIMPLSGQPSESSVQRALPRFHSQTSRKPA